jgi:hypothetical protein
MLKISNAEVVGASAPECFKSDKARVQAGRVGGQNRERTGHSRARGGNVATPAGAATGNVATCDARSLSIILALRRVGHALLSRDDGMWIVRSGGRARTHWPTRVTANASEWQSAREHPR